MPSAGLPPTHAFPGRTLFEGPLADLVAVGLHRPSLEAIASGRVATPPVDTTYLLKILDEEISRPFGHALRPIVELVLNAADAVTGANRVVDVALEAGRVEVRDGGVGMDLATILSRLLLPFATDKVGGVHVGRFGVGFFSVLGFAAQDSGSFAMDVETGDGSSGYALSVKAEGAGAASLVVRLREIPRRTGTHVVVQSSTLDKVLAKSYLEDCLHYFPADRAVLRIGGVPINDGSLVTGGQRYEDEPWEGARARFHLGGRARSASITAATYHQGVKVQGSFAVFDLALLDFPGAVELTEGRDALKPGPHFHAVARVFYRRIAKIGRDPRTNDAARQRLAELAGQISALMLEGAGFAEMAAELAESLLGERQVLVAPERREALLGFFGESYAAQMFVPESFWSAREWTPHLPNERDLIERELYLDPIDSLGSVAARTGLPGLRALAARTDRPELVPVAMAVGRRPAGPLPCLGTRSAVIVRGDSPIVRDPQGWSDHYALRTSFDRASGVREADLEREIIVATPLRVSTAA